VRRAAAPLLLLADRYGAQQQTRSSGVRRADDGTDGQTDAGPFHRPCSAYYASNFGTNPPIGASGQMDET